MTDASLDELGPVDFVIVEFPAGTQDFTGEAADELLALVEAGSIRVIDILILAEAMDPGRVAGVLVYENLRSAPFASAVRRAGGQLIANGRISAQTIIAAIEADEDLDGHPGGRLRRPPGGERLPIVAGVPEDLDVREPARLEVVHELVGGERDEGHRVGGGRLLLAVADDEGQREGDRVAEPGRYPPVEVPGGPAAVAYHDLRVVVAVAPALVDDPPVLTVQDEPAATDEHPREPGQGGAALVP